MRPSPLAEALGCLGLSLWLTACILLWSTPDFRIFP